jgi:hypothetical protein
MEQEIKRREGSNLRLKEENEQLRKAQADEAYLRLKEENEQLRKAQADEASSDEYAPPDVRHYVLVSYEKSNFKRESQWVETTKDLRPREIDRVLWAMRTIIQEHCKKHRIGEAEEEAFVTELQSEWNLKEDAMLASEHAWTSQRKLAQAGDDQPIEFCSIFSQAMREDRASLARACAIFARGLKGNLVSQKSKGQLPPGAKCWRGGGFDDTHQGFFTVGKKYRVPVFLASSSSRAVTETFMGCVPRGVPAVQWEIQFSHAGCKHVNCMRVTHVAGEFEYLFQAYSTFTVLEVQWSAASPATALQPHRITVLAAVDNALECEELPIAPWS